MDILTGLVIWAAQAATLSLLLFIWWMRDRSQMFKLSWSAAFALLATGLLLVGLRGEIATFLSVEIANTMLLASIGLLIGGMQQFDGKRIDPFIAIPALIWVGGMLLPVIRENFSARVILYNVAASIGFAIFIAIVLHVHSGRTWARRLLAGVLGIHIVSSLTNAAMAAVSVATSFSTMPSPAFVLLPGAFCFVAAVLTGAQMMTERSEERLKALASTDPLTGIFNRRGLIDEFQTIRTAVEEEKPLIALLHFDIDKFKDINDRYGHQTGDAVLIAFSRLASISLAPRGAFGRMGGEEFACVLRVSDLIEAATIAEGLRMTLALQTIAAGEHRFSVTVSAGIALQPAINADLDQLLSAADHALYAAKAAGRNRTAVEDGGSITVVPSAAMLTRQEMALEIQASEQVAALRRLTVVGNS
ncbi:GGDEF domain-containing protein [Rhizobium halophilum]|uniref:GGDEF domain-containing protein n=1 Tax=Rhizobium halophilum TaxID=2846852 RepID=UPI001EFEAE3F|nr:GGDEF domain-containing protein [Rhizobium halophilum]MCF6369985.1 GGDEF domain-containing protein [Rhizobium halophilum]